MNFTQAYKELMEGKSIARHAWEDKNFLKLNEKQEIKNYILRSDSFPYDESIILSKQWSLKNGDPNKYFGWIEAIEALKSGADLRNTSVPSNFWISLDKNVNQLMLNSYQEHPFTPSFNCFLANDWIIL